MIPLITINKLRNITFPVYPIPKGDLDFKDGLVLLNGKVLDDKNMPGDTLGKRRLLTIHKKQKISNSMFSLNSVIHSGKLNFIDFHGNLFRYQKTVFSTVKYKKIHKIEYKDTYSVLWLVGTNSPFKVSRPPPGGEKWVGIVYIKNYPWFIYDYSDGYKAPFRKKV